LLPKFGELGAQLNSLLPLLLQPSHEIVSGVLAKSFKQLS
jgi:hypothetical protein